MNRLLVAAALSLSFACASHHASMAPDAEPAAAPRHMHHGALAQLEGRSGSKMVGTARFSHTDGGVVVHLVVSGAEPGEHGVHIHEKGDCSDSKAASAGGHFNPAGMHHGGPAGMDRHAGDLGNIVVDANGNGTLEVVAPGISVMGENNGIAGRSIVVHDKTDDLHTDPSGNSGSRIACGVITEERPAP